MRFLRIIAMSMTLSLLAAACGSDDSPGASGSGTEVVVELASATGAEPFTESVAGDTAAALADAEADLIGGSIQQGTATGLYGGSGDEQVCDRAQLVAFLEADPDKAAAWADAQGIETDELAAYIGGLTPAALLHDTAVTNHGYREGRATSFQAVLEAGTAVLVDQYGVPRARCACGNPLLPPEPGQAADYPGDPIVVVAGLPPGVSVDLVPDTDTDPGEPPSDFCAVYEAGRPDVEGGPAGPDDILPYIERVEAYLNDLITAAEATAGFPEDSLNDLRAYRDDIAAAVAAGDPALADGSTALSDAVEGFLEEYCANPPLDDEPDPPVGDPLPDGPVPNTNCGSLMFFLLIEAADGVGVDWTAAGQPFLEDLGAVTGGLDALADYEEIGCAGAQAVYDVLVDAGYGDALTGSDLDPYA